MPMVAAGAALLGGGITAYGQYQQGQETKKMMNQQASVAEMEANQIRQAGAREADIIGRNQVLNEFRQRKQLDKDKGTMISRFAKAGVAFTGSPLDAIADSISNAELEIDIGNWNAKVNQDTTLYNTRMGAMNKVSQANLQRQYGKSAANNALFQAGGTLLSSVGTAASRFGNQKIGTSASQKIGDSLFSPKGNYPWAKI